MVTKIGVYCTKCNRTIPIYSLVEIPYGTECWSRFALDNNGLLGEYLICTECNHRFTCKKQNLKIGG